MFRILALLAAFIAVPAHADWKMIESEGGYEIYLDFDRIKSSDKGNKVIVWQMYNSVDNKTPPVRSLVAKTQYDCKKEESGQLCMATYSGPMASGQILDTISAELRNISWQPLVPGKPGARIFTKVCKRS